MYKLAEAAQVIGVSVQTLRRYVRSGTVASTKLPGDHGAYLLSEETVLDLCERRTRRGRPIGSRKVLTLQYVDVVEGSDGTGQEKDLSLRRVRR